MTRSFPLLAVCALAVTLVGCDAEGGAARMSAPFSIALPPGDLDVRFAPADLEPGESIELVSTTATLRSLVTPSGHSLVTFDTSDGEVMRVIGLLDGRHQAESGLLGTSGGSTAKTPTSVHRETLCRGNTCTEVVEYDYDLHDPDGEGTTSWRAPSGATAEIDRLRFEVALNEELNAMSLRSDAPLTVVAVRE